MRCQWQWVFCVGLTAGAAVSLAFDSDRARAADQEQDNVPVLMETVHEYPISPWPMAKDASRKEPIDWKTINAALPKLEEMSKALAVAKKKEVREKSGGYIGAVKALGAGAANKDVAAARKAIASLAKSCADCHYKDGPGGEWEDD